MNKEQVKQYIENNPKEGDPLVGFFLALTQPNYWLILSITGVILIGVLFIGLSQTFSLPSVAIIAIIGSCSLFSRKTCFIAVTKSGVFMHILNFFGKFKAPKCFAFAEIESVQIGKGFIRKPLQFTLKNKTKIALNAQLKGAKHAATTKPDVEQYLLQNIRANQ